MYGNESIKIATKLMSSGPDILHKVIIRENCGISSALFTLSPATSVSQELAKAKELGETGTQGLLYVTDDKLVIKSTRNTVISPGVVTSCPIVDYSLDKVQANLIQSSCRDWIYVGFCEFINETIIGGLIAHAWPHIYKGDWSPYVKHHGASIGGTLSEKQLDTDKPIYTIGVMELCNGALDKFVTLYPSGMTRDYMVGILFQVVYALHLLSSHTSFTHGDMKIRNIFVNNESCTVRYGEQEFSFPFTCKIADYGKSGMAYRSGDSIVRVYNHNPLASVYTNVFDGSDPTTKADSFVVDHFTDVQFYVKYRHMGAPYYYDLDVYMAIISFMLHIDFHQAMFAVYPEIGAMLMETLWISDKDREGINSRLKAAYKSPEKLYRTGTCIAMLRKVRMKINVYQLLLPRLASMLG